jgi:sRNA-binding regulator protein Hfq
MPDVAMLYIQKQAEEQTPMVFVTRDQELHATVIEFGTYEHLLRVDGEPTPIKKIALQYHYKAIDIDTVAAKIGVDEVALAKNDPAPLPYNHRYHLSNRDLWAARKQVIPVRFTMRSGVTFTGLIDWFTPYAIKLNIAHVGRTTLLRSSCIATRRCGLNSSKSLS